MADHISLSIVVYLLGFLGVIAVLKLAVIEVGHLVKLFRHAKADVQKGS